MAWSLHMISFYKSKCVTIRIRHYTLQVLWTLCTSDPDSNNLCLNILSYRTLSCFFMYDIKEMRRKINRVFIPKMNKITFYMSFLFIYFFSYIHRHVRECNKSNYIFQVTLDICNFIISWTDKIL